MAARERVQPALLERAAELVTVDTVIAESGAGNGRFAVVEGPAGIGKSSLLAEGRARAAEAGRTVLTARGTDLERAFS